MRKIRASLAFIVRRLATVPSAQFQHAHRMAFHLLRTSSVGQRDVSPASGQQAFVDCSAYQIDPTGGRPTRFEILCSFGHAL